MENKTEVQLPFWKVSAARAIHAHPAYLKFQNLPHQYLNLFFFFTTTTISCLFFNPNTHNTVLFRIKGLVHRDRK